MTTQTTSTARRGRVIVPAVAAADSSPALDALVGDLPSGTRDIPLEQLLPHPANPRRDVGDLSELAASIRAHGIQQNLLAVPDPGDPDRYRLVIGHRRHAAAALAGLATVPVRIDPSLTETQQRELMLLENIQRSDLTPVEEADGYQGLLDLGVPVKTIAKHVGRSQQTVRDRLTLAKSPEAARTAVHDGAATLTDALTLAEFEGTVDYPRVAEAIGTADFGHAVETARRLVEQRVLLDEVLAVATELGIPVLRNADDLPEDLVTLGWSAQRWMPYNRIAADHWISELRTNASRTVCVLCTLGDFGDGIYRLYGHAPTPGSAGTGQTAGGHVVPDPEGDETDPEEVARRAAEAEQAEVDRLRREAERRARDELHETSARLRLAFVHDYLGRAFKPAEVAKHLAIITEHWLPLHADPEMAPMLEQLLLADLLGINVDTDVVDINDALWALPSYTAEVLRSMPTHRALLAVAVASCTPGNTYEWTETPATLALYDILIGLGYTPSTPEADAIAALREAVTAARTAEAGTYAETLAAMGLRPALAGDA